MGVLVAMIFVLVGGGIVYAVIYGTRKVQEQAAAEQSNPEFSLAMAQGLGGSAGGKLRTGTTPSASG